MNTEANLPASVEAEKLTPMIRRAADTLARATTAAEFLDARDHASVAYDAAKTAERFLKAKAAQIEVIAACHQAMGDALKIEAAALCRLADEYDLAQARGEVQTPGGDRKSINVLDKNNDRPTVTDIGLSRKLVLEARIVRDAEKAEPQIVAKTVDEKLKAGEAPQRAHVKRATQNVLAKRAAALAPKQTATSNCDTARPQSPPTPETSSDFASRIFTDFAKRVEKIFMDERKEIVIKHNNLVDAYKALRAGYEKQIDEFNALVADYNELLDKHEKDIADYNKLLAMYRALEAERNSDTNPDDGE